MLKLVLGGSGSGKTTLLYARIKARAEAGQRSILLVPEQFTSSTEGRIYRELGDALSGMVDSYSFTSLAEHILSAEGGAAVQTLSDAGRAVLVRRTLEELQDTVQYYYRHRRSAAFCQMAAETIDELKSAGLSGQQLYRLAQGCGSGSGKLTELALILQGYETLLAGTGMDPSDRLELAADRLEAALARGSLPEFLQDRAVFIDEFDTFNAPKKRLLSALLTALPQVTVALCDDGTPLVPGDTGLFAGAKLVAAQLRQLARKSGTEAAASELLRRDLRHKDAPGLAAVAALLEGNGTEVTQAPEVRLFPAASREEEARCAAAAIRRLMRQGVRCGKIAVVCRDIAKYRAAVRYEFRMADIPLYCDEPTTPEFSAPATAVRALLALLRGADMTEQLTVLAKTGLCALSEEQVCALENYAYTWSPNAAAWRAEFTKNPKGFGENGLTDEDRQNLAWAEDARRKLVDAVDTLRGKVKGGNAEQISRAVYFCLKELGAEEQQAGLVEDIRAARGIPAAEEAAREWNVVMQLLDEMASLLGQQSVTVAEYEDLFGLLLRWFVPGSFVSPAESFWQSAGYLVFPAAAIAIPRIAMTVKMLRSALLAEMNKDYVRTSYSRGNDRRATLYLHVLRNALPPVVSFLAMTVADIVAGSVVIEQVFAIPGLGRLLLTSISNRDYPVVQAVVVLVAFWVVLVNLLGDLLNQRLDPRLRLTD